MSTDWENKPLPDWMVKKDEPLDKLTTFLQSLPCAPIESEWQEEWKADRPDKHKRHRKNDFPDR